ncbi:hypothetical protein SAMN05660199_01758 [Klenkia soli]|uniref:Uncharacterized protein n=1 Tax=Klenkia soli TaxID=1052260 RepID=A0A1H0ISS4_9ACTN|nr:hypothetical protein [Klenkia soli]SDO34330.1 hypothetical protein SAMN05660199_01758 [Klenkia soli]
MDANTDQQNRYKPAKGATVAARIAHWRAMSWEELCKVILAGGPAADTTTVRVAGFSPPSPSSRPAATTGG